MVDWSKMAAPIKACARNIVLALAGMLLALPDVSGVLASEPNRSTASLAHAMAFVIVRSNSALCEPNCPEWIYGEGQLVSDSPAAFNAILIKAGGRRLPLVLVSPGGDVEAAIAIGRTVRRRGMDVQIGFTNFNGCRPFDDGCRSDGVRPGEFYGSVQVGGAFCWSACPLILAAGKQRYSSKWSYTGVHQVTTVYQRQKIYYRERFRMVDGKKVVLSRKVIRRQDAGEKTTTTLPRKTRGALLAYLKQMGVSKLLIDAMLSTSPDKIRVLKPDEMLKLKLVTAQSEGDVVSDLGRCRQTVPAPNCIFHEGSGLSGLPQAQQPPQSKL